MIFLCFRPDGGVMAALAAPLLLFRTAFLRDGVCPSLHLLGLRPQFLFTDELSFRIYCCPVKLGLPQFMHL